MTVFSLGAAIGMRTSYVCTGGPDAELYLFDFNYLGAFDRTHCLAAIRALGHDLSTKTLLLAAKGLHPLGPALLDFTRDFAAHHVFFELWNGLNEVVTLARADLDALYFLPVSTRLQRAGAWAARPNDRVFVSLGGDDDLELVRAVAARCPALHFFVPTVSWTKAGSEKRFVPVRLDASNVTAVDCENVTRDGQLTFSDAYLAAYDACDTVLIATAREKMFQLRGGVRLADALHARKRIVATENAMAQLLMAQDGVTCAVATHDADDVAARLSRGTTDTSTYEALRAPTTDDAKLAWMLGAVADPAAARRSIFFRGGDLLAQARASLLPRSQQLLDEHLHDVPGRRAG